MLNIKLAHAKTLTKNGTRTGKAAMLFLWVLAVGLVLSGCGQKPVDEQTGAAAAAEPAKIAEPLIADCDLPPNPNPDDSEPDGAIEKTKKK